MELRKRLVLRLLVWAAVLFAAPVLRAADPGFGIGPVPRARLADRAKRADTATTATTAATLGQDAINSSGQFEGAVLPQGVSLRSDAAVITGLSGAQVGYRYVLASDPRVSGFQVPIGTIAGSADGTTAYLKTGAGATDWDAIVVGAVVGDEGAFWRSVASKRLGLSGRNLVCLHHEWVTPEAFSLYSNAGGSASVGTLSGQVGTLSVMTGTGAGNGRAASAGFAVGNLRTDRWFLRSRFRFYATAPNAQTQAFIGFSNLTARVGFGYDGARSTSLLSGVFTGVLSDVAAAGTANTVVSSVTGAAAFAAWVDSYCYNSTVNLVCAVGGAEQNITASANLPSQWGAITAALINALTGNTEDHQLAVEALDVCAERR